MNEVIELTKRRLALNGATVSEEVIEYCVQEVVQRILNFCNRDDLPVELHYMVARMVGELVSSNDDGTAGGVASEIKVGDTNVKLSPTSLRKAVDSLMNDFKVELYEFRKIRW